MSLTMKLSSVSCERNPSMHSGESVFPKDETTIFTVRKETLFCYIPVSVTASMGIDSSGDNVPASAAW